MNEFGQTGPLPPDSDIEAAKNRRVWIITTLITAVAAVIVALIGSFWPHARGSEPPAPAATLPLQVTCTLSQWNLRPGLTLRLTYHINSPVARQVGLGAGLYDNRGRDHSNGDGDIDDITVPKGRSSLSRPVVIPANLPASTYELDAEIWPPDEVGKNGVNDLTDASCTFFHVS